MITLRYVGPMTAVEVNTGGTGFTTVAQGATIALADKLAATLIAEDAGWWVLQSTPQPHGGVLMLGGPGGLLA